MQANIVLKLAARELQAVVFGEEHPSRETFMYCMEDRWKAAIGRTDVHTPAHPKL